MPAIPNGASLSLPQRSPPLTGGSTLVIPALILDITQPQWSRR
jgi:hypothetical protein